jgi:F-type H+-transporting ATPase subunit epsilon
MNLVVLSPEKEIFSGEVRSVKVPGTDGAFEMLEKHAAIVSSLGKGEVRIVTAANEKITYQIDGGFVEMLDNSAALLVSGVL